MPVPMHERMQPVDIALRSVFRSFGFLQSKVGEQIGTDAASDEVQRIVARDHAEQRHHQRDGIASDALMREKAAGQQRNIFGHRQAEPA